MVVYWNYLVGYWNFDRNLSNASGAYVKDYSGNEKNCEIRNEVYWNNTDDSNLNLSNRMVFDGVNDDIHCAEGNLGVVNAWTISLKDWGPRQPKTKKYIVTCSTMSYKAAIQP